MKHGYRLFLLLALVGFTPRAQAQQTVRGMVLDASTDEPLAFASLRLSGLASDVEARAASGRDGTFSFGDVPDGRYLLQATFVGFDTTSDTVAVDGVGFDGLLVRLRPSLGTLGEARVEGDRAGLVGESAGLQRIEPADLALVPVSGGLGDLAAYLQTVPGVASLGDRGGQLFIRGSTPAQSLSQLDGIRVERPFHIVGFYSAFPAEVIERADVYSGGFPARFGGRNGSVIDVTSRPGPPDRLDASASLATFQSGARVSGPIVPGRLSGHVTVRESLIERALPSWLQQSFPYRFGDALANVTATLGGTATLGVTALRTHDRGDVAGTRLRVGGAAVPVTPELASRYLIRWENEGVGTTLRAGGDALGGLLRLSASRSRSRVGADSVLRRRATSEALEGVAEVSGRRGALGWRLGGFGRLGELEYRFDDLAGALAADSVGTTEGGGYTELSLRRGGVQVEGGLRVHAYQPAGAVSVEPRARLLWEPPNRGLGRSVGAVSLAAGVFRQGEVGLRDSRESGDAFVAYVPIPDGERLPASRHLLLGIDGSAGSGITVSAETFVKTFSDLRIPRVSSVLLPDTRFDLGSGHAVGADLRADASRAVGDATVTGSVGYSVQSVRHRLDAGGDAFPAPHDRRHQLSLLGKLTVSGFTLHGQFQYGSGLPYTPSAGFDRFIDPDDPDASAADDGVVRALYGDRNARRLPAYHRLDLWVQRDLVQPGYTLGIQLGVMNVYNRANLFYFDLAEFRRVDQIPVLPTLGILLRTR